MIERDFYSKVKNFYDTITNMCYQVLKIPKSIQLFPPWNDAFLDAYLEKHNLEMRSNNWLKLHGYRMRRRAK